VLAIKGIIKNQVRQIAQKKKVAWDEGFV